MSSVEVLREEDAEVTSSDEHVDPYCEQCVEDKKIRTAATGLCKECNTLICQECLEAHSKWPKLRNHTILQGEDMPQSQAAKPVRFPDCEIHKDNVNDHFCLDHHKILCSQCMESFHGACKRTTIHKLCKLLDKNDVRKLRDAIQKSVQTANTVKLAILQNKDTTEHQRKTVIREAQNLKKQLIDKIESINVEDIPIADFCDNKISSLEEKAEATTNAVHNMQNGISLFDDFDVDVVTPKMFLEIQRIVENTNAAHRKLNEVSNRHRNFSIAFDPNPAVANFIESKDELGKIKEDVTDSGVSTELPVMYFPSKSPSKSDSQSLETTKRMHLFFLLAYIVVYVLIFFHHPYTKGDVKTCEMFNMTLTKKSSVNVKIDADPYENVFWGVSGMVITTNEFFLMSTTYVNAFSGDGTFVSSLSLSGTSMAIALINTTTAVVSTMDRKIHFINISLPSELLLLKSVSLVYNVMALTVFNNKLIIADWSIPPSVKMLDLDGKELWSTHSDSRGQELFRTPVFLVTKVINDTVTVVVADYVEDQIVFLDADNGKLINTIDVKGKGPSGIAVDNDEFVYICYWETSEISVWAPDFSQIRILLSSDQLQGRPRHIVYSNVTGELFIRYSGGSIVDRFQVTC